MAWFLGYLEGYVVRSLRSHERPLTLSGILLVSLILIALGVNGLSGCKFPSAPSDSKKNENAKKASRAAEKKAPDTLPPRGKPQRLKRRYDPRKDPQNATATGYDLTKTRAPDAPEDRKKAPFSIQALYQLRSLSSPAVSPDGKWILFTVVTHHLKEGKSEADIYRIRFDGSLLRQMTHHEGVDRHPIWSPDGEAFYFISVRGQGKDKKPQLWKMPMDGGEPRRITNFPLGVSSPVLSADGTKLAFTAKVYPQLSGNAKATLEKKKKRKNSPFKAHLAQELLFRHWTSYRDGLRTHTFVVDLSTGAQGKTRPPSSTPSPSPPESNKGYVDVTPGDYDSPAFSLGGGGIALSPDGKEICFSSNRESPGKRSWTTNKDLFVVSLKNIEKGTSSLKGVPPLNLTATNKAYDGDPAYSPDGKYLAFLRQEKPGYESDRPRLAVYERATGKTRILTEGANWWVVDYRWSRDSKSLIAQGAVKGRFPLFKIEVDTGAITKLPLPSVRRFDVGPGGQLAFTFTRVGWPLELYTLSNGTKASPSPSSIKGKVRRLTGLNDSVRKSYDIRPAEEVKVPGADGKPVHLFIVKPHGFRKGKKYPLILNVHGGPQYQWSDSLRGDWQIYPGAGYVVAFPNPHGSIGYGQKYTEAISRDWGGKVYKDIMKVTDWLSKQPYVDAEKMGVMGWSYGGYMVNWLLGHTKKFKAMASMMGIFDLDAFYYSTEELWFPEWDVPGTPWKTPKTYKKWSPSTYAANMTTPTLIITGELDYRIPYTQSLMLFTALRRQGVPSQLIVFPNDGHWPSWVKSMPLYYAAHLNWFQKYLGGQPAPFSAKDLIYGKAFDAKR